MSLNVNGLVSDERRRKIISHYVFPVNSENRPDIFCLQECGTQEEYEEYMLQEFQYDLCFAHYPELAKKGLITGFRRDLDYVMYDYSNIIYSKSQALITHCKIQDFDYVIVNFYYHPSEIMQDLGKIFSMIKEKLLSFKCDKVIWCGDFNTVLTTLDTADSVIKEHHALVRNFLEPVLDTCEFADIFRVLNPSERRFTYIRKNYGARLDYIFVSMGVINRVEKADIGFAYVTDHAPTYITFCNDRNTSGRNYWKFPNYLLECVQFKDELRKYVPQVIDRNKHELSPAILWDFVKNKIKDFTCKYISNKNRIKKDRIEDVERRIFELTSQLPYVSGNQFEAVREQIKTMIGQFDIIHKADWKEYYIGRMQQNNEHSSKLFFHRIESIPGSICQLHNQQDEIVTSDQDILRVCTDFYQDLLVDKNVLKNDEDVTEDSFPSSLEEDGDLPYCFIPDDISLRLNKQEETMLDADISFEELRSSIMSMKKGKSPGYDGLTVDFYHEFFDLVGPTLYDSIVYTFQHGELSISQKRGVIKLIPKRDKDSTFVKNLRPITLLNVDVKILSRVLAARLQSVISSIINKDQNTFIKGRNIGENILDVYSMIAAAEDNEETDILVFLDIEKAYDTVSWRFLSTVLHKLGFPDSFVRWVEILHRNKEIRFFNNGYSSSPVYPNKGLAQGCALSPLLFIIAMSRLSEVINRNANIVGINCGGKTKKCCLAADDTVIGTRANEENIQELCSVLSNFYSTSGLKVNYNKSVIMKIGKDMDVRQLIASSEEFVWLSSGDKTKYLGIFISDQYYLQDNECVLLLNANDIATVTQGLRYQGLSIIGRILILKSLINSKLVYKFLHYPLPENGTLKCINNVYFDFVWRGRHRILAKDMIQPIEKGGFNMVNVHYQCEALQFQWLSKTLLNMEERAIWEHYLRSCILIPLEQFLRCNCFARSFHKLIKNVKAMPAFWLRLFQVWFRETYVRTAVEENIFSAGMTAKGIVFNSVCNRDCDKSLKVQMDFYQWLKDFGCFTFEDVKEVW